MAPKWASEDGKNQPEMMVNQLVTCFGNHILNLEKSGT
jgi:hypothetical protein